MPSATSQLPDDGGDLARWRRGIDARLKQLEAARRLQNASIGAGGLTIDGGALDVITPAGVDLLKIGPVQWNHLDGSTQQGVVIRREDGTQALAMYAVPAVQGNDVQAMALWDRTGNAIIAEDTLAGVGIALPYLPIAWAPARYTDWFASTAAAFEDVHQATIKKMQPWAYVVIGATTDVSGTTGQIQLTINGVPWGAPTVITFLVGSTTIGPFPLPGNFKDQIDLRIQAMRTAGTGAVRCAVLASSGLQS